MRYILPLALLAATAPVFSQSPSDTAVPSAAKARDMSAVADQIVDVLNGKLPAQDVFTDGFLAEVTPGKLTEVAKSLTDQFGQLIEAVDVVRTGPNSAKFKLRFAKATGSALIEFDPVSGKVGGFMITDFVPLDTGPEALISEFKALHGTAGFTITRLGTAGSKEMLGLRLDQQFAIGSAFKLWVLDALAEDIARGKRRWSDVVPLSVRSLPSGVMQTWPQGSPVTLATLATQMISISDNTATDQLIKVLGRDAIAARVRATGHSAPSRMLPMLTTLEAFSLKLGPAAPRDSYIAASDAQQSAMLARLGPTFSPDRLSLGQLAPGKVWHIDTIEWFASPRDMVGVMQSLQRRKDPRVMQILSVNSGLGLEAAKQFSRLGFKGGSEEGVLNLTWLAQNKAGEWYVVSASWNDPAKPVDLNQFLVLSRRLLERVK